MICKILPIREVVVHCPVFPISSIVAPFPSQNVALNIQIIIQFGLLPIAACMQELLQSWGWQWHYSFLLKKCPFLQEVSLKLQGMISNGVTLLLISLFYCYSGKGKPWCLSWLLANAAASSSSQSTKKTEICRKKKKIEEIPSCLSCSYFSFLFPYGKYWLHKEDEFGKDAKWELCKA